MPSLSGRARECESSSCESPEECQGADAKNKDNKMRGAASGGRPRAMLTSSGSCLEVCGVLALGSFKLVPLRGRPEADRQSELLWEFRPRRSLTSSPRIAFLITPALASVIALVPDFRSLSRVSHAGRLSYLPLSGSDTFLGKNSTHAQTMRRCPLRERLQCSPLPPNLRTRYHPLQHK